MMRIAITRASPEAEKTAARLRDLGAEPILAPLMSITPMNFDSDITGAQALLFTSANGVRAFIAANPRRDIEALCVGETTANAAKTAGFVSVRNAQGDSRALADMARRRLKPNAGRVIHFSGFHVAGDPIAILAKAGFAAERRAVYDAVAVAGAPQALLSRLDVVLFHSARAAEICHRLGAPDANQRTAACLSRAVADAARLSPWARVIIAPHPSEETLLQLALLPSGASA